MEAQWLLIKELGKSEEQTETRLSKMITEKILEGAREILEAIEKRKKGTGWFFYGFSKKEMAIMGIGKKGSKKVACPLFVLIESVREWYAKQRFDT